MAHPQVTAPKDLVKASYDQIAPAYLNFIAKLPSPKLVWVERLLSKLPSPTSAEVLELGCGNGMSGTAEIADKVKHVVANDISTAQIEIAKQKLSDCRNVDFLAGDMMELAFEEQRFHAVVALHSIFHLPRDEQPEMLRLVHKWLRPRGLLLVNFDEEENPGKIMEGWLGADMFSSSLGVEGSKKMLVEAGFNLVEVEVVRTVDEKKTVPFLWVIAQKEA